MTAHDPRVTLTKAEVERLCASECGLDFPEQTVAVVADLIAARLAPIRALADKFDGHAIGRDFFGNPLDSWVPVVRLRAALEASSAPVSASQDHDGAEGQGEGERPADRRCPTCGIPFAHYTHDPQGRPL